MQPHLAAGIEKNTRKQFPDGIAAFGTDALRFTFASLAGPSRDIRFDLGRVGGYRNFCNKLWNGARFVLMMVEGESGQGDLVGAAEFSVADRWITSRFAATLAQVDSALNEYRFDYAATALYEFTWYEFCDWYLELTKPVLQSETVHRGAEARHAPHAGDGARSAAARAASDDALHHRRNLAARASVGGAAARRAEDARQSENRGQPDARGLPGGQRLRARHGRRDAGEPAQGIHPQGAPDPRRDEHRALAQDPAAGPRCRRTGAAAHPHQRALSTSPGRPREPEGSRFRRCRARLGQRHGGGHHAAGAAGGAHRCRGRDRPAHQGHRKE